MLYIENSEHGQPAKVLHVEPIHIDPIRDLGARKGENEWNIGFGLTDRLDFDAYEVQENFIGLEFNKFFDSSDFDMAIRPQN